MNPTSKEIYQRLKAALQPIDITVRDDSDAHKNHLQAQLSGGGHYHLYVVSNHFEGKSLLARHRLVYNALEGMIGPNIHALQIVAKTPEEHVQG